VRTEGTAAHGRDKLSDAGAGAAQYARDLVSVRFAGAADGYEPKTAEKSREAGNMLVLTRKSNQSIMIGDEIEVSVLSIMGEKVRIGIQAPRDIPVFRKEVYLEIQQEGVAPGGSARAEVDDALKRLSQGS